jgi:hypothetical protein
VEADTSFRLLFEDGPVKLGPDSLMQRHCWSAVRWTRNEHDKPGSDPLRRVLEPALGRAACMFEAPFGMNSDFVQ